MMNRRLFFKASAWVSAAAVVGLRADTHVYRTWFVKPGMEGEVAKAEARVGRRFDHVFVGQKIRPCEPGSLIQVWDKDYWRYERVQENTLFSHCHITIPSPHKPVFWRVKGVYRSSQFIAEPLAPSGLSR